METAITTIVGNVEGSEEDTARGDNDDIVVVDEIVEVVDFNISRGESHASVT